MKFLQDLENPRKIDPIEAPQIDYAIPNAKLSQNYLFQTVQLELSAQKNVEV